MSELETLMQTMLSRAAKGEQLLGGRRRPSEAFGGRGFVQVQVVGGGKFREMVAKLSNMRPAYGAIGRLGQRVVGAEFDRSSKMGARGGFSRWKASKAFGTRPKSGRTGTATGALGGSWSGGDGSIFRVLANGVTFGTRVAYAAPFRSGWKQTITDRQRIFLGMEFNVWLTPGKTISAPARPHAEFTSNLAFLRDAGIIMLAHVAGASPGQLLAARGQIRV